jgi:hypothetical protein
MNAMLALMKGTFGPYSSVMRVFRTVPRRLGRSSLQNGFWKKRGQWLAEIGRVVLAFAAYDCVQSSS